PTVLALTPMSYCTLMSADVMQHTCISPSICACHLFFFILRPPPSSTLFPYTTLFRSRLANTSLRAYAYNLLHFVRWWESVHHTRSEEHTSELQSHLNLVCRLLLEKKKKYGIFVYSFVDYVGYSCNLALSMYVSFWCCA